MIVSRSNRQQMRDGSRAAVAVASERIDRLRDRAVPYLLAKITGSTAISGETNRWEYTWTRAEVVNNASRTFQQVSSEPWYSGTAFNTMEGGNTTTTVTPGVTVSNIPTGWSVKPVSGYVILFPHRCTDGTERWLFCVPNAIDGSC